MRRTICLSILLLFLLLCTISPSRAQEKKPLDVGDRVADFTVRSLNGKELQFEKDILSGSGLSMVFFMTTACSACFEELKEIDEYVGENPGKLSVWAVAVDLRGEKTVRPYADTYKFAVNYIIDPKFKLPRLFGFSYTPSFVLVSSEGVILYKKGGYTAGEDVKGIIKKFVK